MKLGRLRVEGPAETQDAEARLRKARVEVARTARAGHAQASMTERYIHASAARISGCR
jgi:hypothetical protein